MLVSELQNHLNSLSERFLVKYLKTNPRTDLTITEEEKQDLKIFSVLSHAAFEEYFELVSSNVLNKSIKEYKTNAKVTKPLLTLILFSNCRLKIDYDKDLVLNKPINYVIEGLDKIKSEHSKTIKENHGISIKYLKDILIPVYVEVSDDPNFLQSLSKLADARGSAAHSRDVASVLNPDEIEKWVKDIIEYCKKVEIGVESLFK